MLKWSIQKFEYPFKKFIRNSTNFKFKVSFLTLVTSYYKIKIECAFLL